MKTWTKWLIFIVIQIINYVIGYLYTSHILHDIKMWSVLIIIGTIFTIASFILILIPTNEREKKKAQKFIDSGASLPWENPTVVL